MKKIGKFFNALFKSKPRKGANEKDNIINAILSNSIIILVGFAFIVSLILIISEKMGTNYLDMFKLKMAEKVSPGYSGIKDYTEKIKTNFDELQKTVNVFDELEKLSKENAQLKRYKSMTLALYLENEQLKKLIGFKKEKKESASSINNFDFKNDFEIIPAQLVGNITNSFNKTAYVEYAESGLEGSVVYAEYEGENILIGIVELVGDKYSKVMLITNPEFSTPVSIIPPQEKAILQGDNSPYPVIRFFSIDNKIKEGDSVLTDDDGNYFPKNLLIGYVDRFEQEKIVIRPVINWNKVYFVNILKKKNKKF